VQKKFIAVQKQFYLNKKFKPNKKIIEGNCGNKMANGTMRNIGSGERVILQCKICWKIVKPEKLPSKRLKFGSWQCPNGCKEKPKNKKRVLPC
jgi:hypothetical protein